MISTPYRRESIDRAAAICLRVYARLAFLERHAEQQFGALLRRGEPRPGAPFDPVRSGLLDEVYAAHTDAMALVAETRESMLSELADLAPCTGVPS